MIGEARKLVNCAAVESRRGGYVEIDPWKHGFEVSNQNYQIE